MPSRADVRGSARAALVAAAVLAIPAASCTAASAPVAKSTSSAPGSQARPPLSVAAVEAAASSLRADPNLGGVEKRRTWRLKRKEQPSEPPATPDSFWWNLGRWLAESGRGLVWLLGAGAFAMVLVAARRWLAVHGAARNPRGARLPSHVRQLDIRPESLPRDIGAEVRRLWLAGERRASLSLLYRGALSRLVHSYAVAIGDASTEGDCVRLARAALPPAPSDFIAALVGAWQLAVYGGRQLADDDVLRLCDDFDRLLPATGGATPGTAASP